MFMIIDSSELLELTDLAEKLYDHLESLRWRTESASDPKLRASMIASKQVARYRADEITADELLFCLALIAECLELDLVTKLIVPTSGPSKPVVKWEFDPTIR